MILPDMVIVKKYSDKRKRPLSTVLEFSDQLYALHNVESTPENACARPSNSLTGKIIALDKKRGLTKIKFCEAPILLVPRTRIELVQGQAPRDFKSLASTNSATQAFFPASCKTRMLYTGAFYR